MVIRNYKKVIDEIVKRTGDRRLGKTAEKTIRKHLFVGKRLKSFSLKQKKDGYWTIIFNWGK